MVNVFSMEGLLTFVLLFVCTCAFMKRVPKLKETLFAEKNGVFGSLYKGAVIGTRLHLAVSLGCLVMGFYLVFLK